MRRCKRCGLRKPDACFVYEMTEDASRSLDRCHHCYIIQSTWKYNQGQYTSVNGPNIRDTQPPPIQESVEDFTNIIRCRMEREGRKIPTKGRCYTRVRGWVPGKAW